MSVEAFDIVRSAPVLETDAPLDALITIVQRFLRRHTGTDHPGERTLRAVAVGFPSTVDVTRRVVLSTANIAALQNLTVVDVLESAFEVPVVIDRDVNFLLRHDVHDLGLTGLPIIVGCYLGTGLGNAIAIGGEILVGAHGVAGELGHVPGSWTPADLWVREHRLRGKDRIGHPTDRDRQRTLRREPRHAVHPPSQRAADPSVP